MLATMINLIKGYLWYTPPCAQAPFGWFYTNRFDLLTLVRKTGDREEVVDHETDEFKDFLNKYNKKEMIVNRLHNPEKYESDMMLLNTMTISNRLQQHYQLYLADTRIDPVLPSPEN